MIRTRQKAIRLILIIIALTGLAIYYFYPEHALPANMSIDRLVVYKSKRKLNAYSNGKLVKIYSISLGGNPEGDKGMEGDEKTPEGLYFINDKNPHSGYHKNLSISYPNNEDIKKAKESGKPPGGDH